MHKKWILKNYIALLDMYYVAFLIKECTVNDIIADSDQL
jgi:hypothetical protein